MAVPVAAFKKVERVTMELSMAEKDKEKFEQFTDNLFEVFLKEDFIELFVSPEFEAAAQ